MNHHLHCGAERARSWAARRLLGKAVVALAMAASSVAARAEDGPVPTPAALTQILSCQGRDALGSFAELLFLQDRPPAWMHASEPPSSLEGMIGLYGFAIDGKVSVFGEPVDRVYFMKDWVVALLPRESAERIVGAQKMERAPIAATEQYYRFVDPETGPMIGAFAPGGDAMARLLMQALGGDPEPRPTARPVSSRAETMLVGCNYAVASQAEFQAAAHDAEETLRQAGARSSPDGRAGRAAPVAMTAPDKTLREITLALLAARAPGATICPSEVARAFVAAAGGAEAGAEAWRAAMPEVHAAVDALLAERAVALSWKGEPLATRAGPYRIGRRASA